jgi:hypothetical protein
LKLSDIGQKLFGIPDYMDQTMLETPSFSFNRKIKPLQAVEKRFPML